MSGNDVGYYYCLPYYPAAFILGISPDLDVLFFPELVFTSNVVRMGTAMSFYEDFKLSSEYRRDFMLRPDPGLEELLFPLQLSRERNRGR